MSIKKSHLNKKKNTKERKKEIEKNTSPVNQKKKKGRQALLKKK